jgi:hypothetical protein
MTPEEQRREANELCVLLPLIMDRAHRAGLHRTGHALHEAVREVAEKHKALDK